MGREQQVNQQQSVQQSMNAEQKYKILIRSLIALSVGLLLIILTNFELARRNTVATKHMDAIGDTSDLMFEIASDTQRLSIVDGTDNEKANQLIDELKEHAKIIDSYLVKINQYPQKETYLASFNQEWQVYRNKINALKPQQFSQVPDLNQRIELANYAYAKRTPLYDTLNNGYKFYIEETYTLGNYTRALQALTLLGLLGFLFFFVTYTFKRMRVSDNLVAKAQQETHDIMATVNEGLFLIDKDLNIGEQYSAKLASILNQPQLAGRNLVDVLKDTVLASDLEATQMFVEQLYNNWVVEELIQDLNPLKQVLLSYVDERGISDTKFLSFNFLRVMDGTGQVHKVFVSVVDITNEIRLQRQIELDQAQHNRQIEMISYLISVDATQIRLFIEQAKQRITHMNGVLKTDNQQDFIAKAQQLFRDMHSLKGDASAIKLEAVVELAQRAESQLKRILQLSEVKGTDFLQFTIGLNELLELIQFIEQLMTQLNFAPSVSATTSPLISPTQQLPVPQATQQSSESYWQTFFSQYATAIAERQHKQVAITVTGFDQLTVTDNEMAVYKDISVQLLKNAIVHGIETPEQRLASQKSPMGQITLSLTQTNNQRELIIRDDGQGIDWQKIRQKAVALGKITAEQAQQLTPKQQLALLFATGISTADGLDEDAGQGVGMDIVRQLAVDGQGQLSLTSQPHQFTQFMIKFPIS